VLTDGRQWLIEVKNSYDKEPFRQLAVFTAPYVQQLQDYAVATQCPLKFAVYWARWGTWTLVAPEALVWKGNKLTIEMPMAMAASEMGELGDRTIGTRPPLRLRFFADREKPRHRVGLGQVAMTIAGAAMFSDETEILDPIEKQTAWIFMQFGDWQMEGPTAITSGVDVDGVEFVWTPNEQANEGFEFIGTLSSMFSRYYVVREESGRR
jgi:hypothetical protein